MNSCEKSLIIIYLSLIVVLPVSLGSSREGLLRV
jgi:hypothetical protein